MYVAAVVLLILSGIFYAAGHRELGAYSADVCRYGSMFCDNPTYMVVAAGIGEEDRAAAMDEAAGGAWAAALAYARRRRIGPFAAELADRDGARRAIAAMIRAGHDYATARKIVASPPGEVPDSRED